MKYLTLIFVVILFASCHNYKKDAEQLQTKVDSLQTVAENKDAAIEEFLTDFTDIQSNLDSIKKMESMMAVPEEPEKAISDNRKERILSDINAINKLLQENKEMIASLKQRLNNSNFKTGKLEQMVDDLEKLTAKLEGDVAQRDAQIATLNEQVQEQSENISQMNQRIEQMEELSASQLDSLKLKEAELNKAFYVVGTIADLKDQGIVEREGGILGIGSTPVVTENFPKEMFTEVDIREFDMLPLNSKKADVISVHPIDSYHVAGEQMAENLVVDDAQEFWSASKYLVVVTK